MKVFFNNAYFDESEVDLNIQNRGFNFGDGIFETIMATEDTVRFLEDHILRLKNALNTLKIIVPEIFNFSDLNRIIYELRKQNAHKGISRIKIQVWRKSGGLFSPTSHEAEFLITAIEGRFNLDPRISVAVYNEFRLNYTPISSFKKLSSLQYVMGGIFKNENKVDDIIFLDTEGHVAESMASNIFWSKENTIYTPSLMTGCIDGIMRKQLRLFFANKNMEFKEGKFQLSELLKADMAFVSNVAGINAIQKIESVNYNSEAYWFKELQQQLMNH